MPKRRRDGAGLAHLHVQIQPAQKEKLAKLAKARDLTIGETLDRIIAGSLQRMARRAVRTQATG